MNPLWLIAASIVAAPVPEEAVRTAVTKGIKRLEAAATNYTKNRSCFSCHHQAVPLMGMIAAKERGFDVDADIIAEQAQFTLDTFKPKLKTVRDGSGIGGANTTAAYALHTLQIVGHKRDETTDALIEFLLKTQHVEGYWKATTSRPPSEGSSFTSTALALQAFKHYGGFEDRATNEETKRRYQQVREKAVAFLKKVKPETTEDRVFRLRALVAIGDEDEVVGVTVDLLNRQRADGGWAQLDDMKSDAYATGSAIVALRIAGLSIKDEVYRRAVRYLVRSQDESGAWIVQTRSKPIQKLFDNGDPGGKSQFISTAATGWAVFALSEMFPKR